MRLNILLKFLFFISKLNFVLLEEDLYKIMGVDKSSSLKTIKQAYKALAKEWHPDKNRSPGANEKFMKINEAYETLSDAEKRSHYDLYGKTSSQMNSQDDAFNSEGSFHFHFGNGGPFTFQFNNFAGGESILAKYRINLWSYENKILEESITKPYLIYVYADFCFQCMQMTPIWQQTVQDLEKIGMGIGSLNANMEGGLIRKLRVTSVPTILAVINKKIKWFNGPSYQTAQIREFTRKLLPTNLITNLDEQNYDSFMSIDEMDNKVKVIMFDTRKQFCLRFALSAFMYQQTVKAAYMNINKMKYNSPILRELKISRSQENLLIFKEDTSKPAAQISMAEISRVLMDETITPNQFLNFPRLSNPIVFEHLCPIKSSIKLKKLCVLLFMQKANIDKNLFSGFLKFVEKKKSDSRVKFGYVYEDVQQPFVSSFVKSQYEKPNQSEDYLKVAIIWRKTTNQMRFDLLEDGWPKDLSSSREDSKLRILKLIDTYLMLDETLPFAIDFSLQHIIDENSETLFFRILNRLYDWLEKIYDYLIRQDEMMLTALVIAFIVVCGTLCFKFITFSSREYDFQEPNRNMNKKNQRRNNDSPFNNQSTFTPSTTQSSSENNELLKLNASTYEQLINKAVRGYRIILLLVDSESQDILIAKFNQICIPFTKPIYNFIFSHLQLENHHKWILEVLSSATTKEKNNFRKLSNCVGSVIALNPVQKSFYIYRSMVATVNFGEIPDSTDKVDFLNLEEGSGDDDLNVDYDNDDDDDDKGLVEGIMKDRQRDKSNKHTTSYLEGFNFWLEKLCEGTLDKYFLNSWPAMT